MGVLPSWMTMYHVRAVRGGGSEDTVWSPGTRVTASCESPRGAGNQTQDPLEDQSMLLTIEPSVQIQENTLYNIKPNIQLPKLITVTFFFIVFTHRQSFWPNVKKQSDQNSIDWSGFPFAPKCSFRQHVPIHGIEYCVLEGWWGTLSSQIHKVKLYTVKFYLEHALNSPENSSLATWSCIYTARRLLIMWLSNCQSDIHALPPNTDQLNCQHLANNEFSILLLAWTSECIQLSSIATLDFIQAMWTYLLLIGCWMPVARMSWQLSFSIRARCLYGVNCLSQEPRETKQGNQGSLSPLKKATSFHVPFLLTSFSIL